MKISIIVPVYNVEKYIDRCITSILHQNYDDYELLIIDDGSTDSSGFLCDKYTKFSQVKIFHKKNGGLSDARNYGINKAKGKYLMFVDGDDFLYNITCLKRISEFIDKTKADVIQYKMVYFYDRKDKYVFQKPLKNIKGNFYDKLFFMNKNGQISVSACDKIVKRKVIIDNGLFFENGLLSEDVLWSLKVYMKINTIELLNKDIYVYRQQRHGSISTSKSCKVAKDLFYIIKYWMNYEYNSEETKKLYYNIIAYWYLILRVKFNKKYYDKEMLNYFKKNDSNIILYCNNYKVKKAYKISRIFGFNFSIFIMKIYLYLKNKGIIKI